MSGWNKWSVKRKLFSVILLILILNVIILLVMGSSLFEGFYQTNKLYELRENARDIQTAYQKNSDEIYEVLSRTESKNTEVMLLSLSGDGKLQIDYHSRNQWDNPPLGVPLPPEIEKKIQERETMLLERIKRTGTDFLIETGGENGKRTGWEGKKTEGQDDKYKEDSLSLSVRLDDNVFLYIQTPRGYIKSTADLAVKYTALLSIAILLCGSVVIYFVVGRITKPLSRIQEVAGQISKLDFSQKCEARGGDEISMLAASINRMSDDLQQAVDQMREANAVLQSDLVRQQQTDRMRQQFVANVSHDFKTPLTLMISYAEALREDENLSDADREYCEIIVSEGNKLSRMVGKLLGLSKLESGIDKVEYSFFCLSEVVDAVIYNHTILTEKRGIEVRQELEDAFIVTADFAKIEQVVTNLFENAAKYVPDGGRVLVTAKRIENRCRVAVENSGNPISEEDIGSLFDSFYRADKSRTTGDSYGLGLAIVKVIMEAHHQAYDVENTETGVRFWFELELADFDDEEDAEEADEESADV